MAGTYNAVNAKCPYYVYENDEKKEIKCHGIVPNTYATHKFKFRREYEAQVEKFCDGDYWRCEYCCALDGYWKDMD